MDGNGRWARERGQPREFGHRRGMKRRPRGVEAAGDAGVEVLTLFAFSQRELAAPPGEVTALMGLLELYVRRERRELKEKGVEVRVIGDLDRLGPRTRGACSRSSTTPAAAPGCASTWPSATARGTRS
jgi:undecaprenyl diphosphate synthase